MARHAPPVRLKAATATVSGQSPDVPPPTPDPNFPLNGWGSQGYYAISGASRFTNGASETEWAAERDVLILQHFGVPNISTVEQFTGYYKNIKQYDPNNKIVAYSAFTGVKRDNVANLGWPDYLRDLMASGTRGGGESWWLHDGLGNRVQAKFSSAFQRINHCPQFTGSNSFGRNIYEQALTEWHGFATTINVNGKEKDYFNGIYLDVAPPAPQEVYVDGVDPRVETSADYDEDGIADLRGDEADGLGVEDLYGGARMHRRGQMYFPDAVGNIWGSGFAFFANLTRMGLDYTNGPLSNGQPISTNEYYQAWDGTPFEDIWNGIGFRKNQATNEYDIDFGGGWNFVFRHIERQKACIKPDSTHTWYDTTNAKYLPCACHVLECNFLNLGRAQDYNAMRFFGGIAALSGSALGHQVDKSEGLPPLDEFVYDWGDTVSPYNGNDGDRHMMGILDPTTAPGGTNADYSGNRPADLTNGSGEFWWAEFENCIWVVRGDQTGIVGGVHGDGSAVSCTLPSAGTGFHWERFDVTSTYTNPNTGRQTRGQDTTLNAGGTITSVSLLPWHAQMCLRVAD